MTGSVRNARWFLIAGLACLLSCTLPSHRTHINPRDGLPYVWIKPGSYFTGCLPEDSECIGWERRSQLVNIEHGFWIGQTEVTQAAYERITGFNPSRYRSPLHPVEQVDFQSARSYCKAVGMKLPTESQWEFAAEGGASKPRYGALDAIAWFDSNSGDSTHDVAQKKPNGYGLFDMLGNVWEWVDGTWEADPHRRIMKGGSFYNLARDLRVPNREEPVEELRHRNVGFRCASD